MLWPRSTYRIQFTPEFGFRHAAGVAPYLAELGITGLYASPIFKAVKGSLHGYDVVDPNELNPELGTPEEFAELMTEVENHGLAWIQDIVPNHMALNSGNRMLMDVLENGQSSEFRSFFDVDWNSPQPGLRGKLLIPFLGKFYGESLESGEIQLRYDESGFSVNYYDYRFPLKIESYPTVITFRLDRLRKRLGRDNPDLIELQGVLYVLQGIPPGASPRERGDQLAFVKHMLWELYNRSPDIRKYISDNLVFLNGVAGKPASFNELDHLLNEQRFRLAFWKVAAEEINYKRFFTINELISVRVDIGEVFDYTHSLLLRLLDEKKFHGFRVDHVDGLYDPAGYLKRLRDRAGGDCYIVIEKILELEENIPLDWPVQGATGYDFMNFVNGLFCDGENEAAFDRIYADFTGIRESYRDLEYEKKRLIIESHLYGDIDNLAGLMREVSAGYRHGNDITLPLLRSALIEVMARFPVYRTYVGSEVDRTADAEYIRTAVREAVRSRPDLTNELRYIETFLLIAFGISLSDEAKRKWMHALRRFQQYTVPLMAKGVEDTVLYNYNRLLSLNEVGGNPYRFGITPDEFHAFNLTRAEFWPAALNATATHDTKRGEDVRARINVLSEIPEEWAENVRQWSRLNSKVRKRVRGKVVPDANEEYFLYQTLIGAFPFNPDEYPSFRDRVREYIRKSSREAKVHSAWFDPDTAFEEAFISFVEAVLRPGEDNRFLKEFLPFQKKIAGYGVWNSLSQTLLKITAPGVPDFYRGTELWDLNLVDPDNRRPVDFERRKFFLGDIRIKGERDMNGLIGELLGAHEDGRVKAFLIQRALRARNDQPDLFLKGAYLPLQTGGSHGGNLVAFARRLDTHWAVVIVPRLLTGLVGEGAFPLGREIWENTRIILPGESPEFWRNAVTGEEFGAGKSISAATTLKRFPGALLLGEGKKNMKGLQRKGTTGESGE